MEIETILLSSQPADAFSITAGPGNVFSGAAVGFKPQQDCSLTSVRLLLRNYTGANGQQFKLELLNNNGVGPMNRPGTVLSGSFDIPAHNDGSIAEFKFDFTGNAPLKAGTIYWISVCGVLNAVSMVKGSQAYWLAGGTPAGTADFIQSCQNAAGNFLPHPLVPAFVIDVAV